MNKKPIILLLLLLVMIVSAIAEDTLIGTANLRSDDTGFLGSAEGKISTLFPIILLLVCIVSYMIDFGTTGVILGAMGTLLIAYLFKLISINPVNLISFILMGGILVFSLKN